MSCLYTSTVGAYRQAERLAGCEIAFAAAGSALAYVLLCGSLTICHVGGLFSGSLI